MGLTVVKDIQYVQMLLLNTGCIHTFKVFVIYDMAKGLHVMLNRWTKNFLLANIEMKINSTLFFKLIYLRNALTCTLER